MVNKIKWNPQQIIDSESENFKKSIKSTLESRNFVKLKCYFQVKDGSNYYYLKVKKHYSIILEDCRPPIIFEKYPLQSLANGIFLNADQAEDYLSFYHKLKYRPNPNLLDEV